MISVQPARHDDDDINIYIYIIDADLGFFYQLDPEVRRLERSLERLHLKILDKKQSTLFNQTCLYT